MRCTEIAGEPNCGRPKIPKSAVSLVSVISRTGDRRVVFLSAVFRAVWVRVSE